MVGQKDFLFCFDPSGFFLVSRLIDCQGCPVSHGCISWSSPAIFSIKSKRIFQAWSLNNFWSIRNLSCFSLRPFPAPNFFSPLFLQLPHISGDVILNEMYSQIVEKKRALGMMEKRKKGKTNAPFFFSSFLFSYHIR